MSVNAIMHGELVASNGCQCDMCIGHELNGAVAREPSETVQLVDFSRVMETIAKMGAMIRSGAPLCGMVANRAA